ncbi:MAG TPA: TIGR03560 family F420-dependent LLM class oxidoreductase [Candidatus Caenarcaniphilales bacterium]|nr:TIGR03560 family F420-dependent LLM class oxidoreductase [Candidatus Caenarcaniphilales bacterium]
MRFALMTEPQQGLSYAEILAIATTAEEAGFEAFFRSDHYASFPGEADLPTTDAWATLAGLARETSRIQLGTLVSPVTFRLPGSFAKVVTTVAEMSGGRLEVGVGAGWNELEHRQLGIPFPGNRERYDMLEEQLAILHGLWTEPDGWCFDGRHWQVRDTLFRPRPSAPPERRHPNLILGGAGGPRQLHLVARYADEYNLLSAAAQKATAVYQRLDEACVRMGRDPGEVTRSAMTGVLVGEDEADVQRRTRELLQALGQGSVDADAWLAERRQRWIMGTPDEARRRVDEFESAGVQRLMLQDFLPRDLEMVRLLGASLLG